MLAKYKRSIVITMLIAPFVLLLAEPVNANQANPALTLLTSNEDGSEYGISLQILVLMTVLTVVPSILIMMTSFTRIIIVLSLLRQALGTAQTPPNQVLIGIAFFLTIFIMKPVAEEVYAVAYEPVENSQITFQQGLERAVPPLKEFMLAQVREKDLMMFMDIAVQSAVSQDHDVPLETLIPALSPQNSKPHLLSDS